MSTTPDQIVYFGDSITDNGNLLAFAEDILAPEALDGLAGPTGAASNGSTYAAYAADFLGIDSQNYAVASAEVDGVQDLAFVAENFEVEEYLTVAPDDPILDTDINLDGQVDRFLDDNSGQDLSGTTAFILIGANDYNEIDLTSDTVIKDVLQKMQAVVSGIAEEALRLWQAGVGTIMISTLPSADFYAATATLPDDDMALANAAFSVHNLYLEKVVAMLSAVGVNAQIFDVATITDTLTEDPTAFGFIAPLGTTLTGEGMSDTYDDDQILSYDALHPTTAGHAIIGAYTAWVVEGNSAVALSDRTDGLRGDDSSEFISALGGDDYVRAGGGNDVVIGGTGDDNLIGDAGNDLLNGGSGNDFLRGNTGVDILGGGEGDDTILGGAGDDLIVDGLGNDVCYGGKGDDTFIFTQAALIGGTDGDADLFDGGAGTDRLIVVLDTDSYAALSADLESGDATAALASLGITATGVEDIIAVDGRDGLSAFANQPWYEVADVLGIT